MENNNQAVKWIDRELLPCPFCGSSTIASRAKLQGDHRLVWVMCKGCRARTGVVTQDATQDYWEACDAVEKAWNTRNGTLAL